MESGERFKPFSNGTEMIIWYERNCWGCKLHNKKVYEAPEDVTDNCPMEQELATSIYSGDEKISPELVERLGGGIIKKVFLGDCQHKQEGKYESPDDRAERERQEQRNKEIEAYQIPLIGDTDNG